MYLFFDVETNGLPRNWKRHHTDTFNWPRMVQIAWQLYDSDRKLVEEYDAIIIPEGFEISYEAERVHKIDTEKAREEGKDLKETLLLFSKVVDKAEYIIAHNLNLAENVVGAEFYRKSIDHRLFSSERYCTMQESTWYCKLPGKQGRYKWPSLQELHVKLFGSRMEGAHNAKTDVEAIARCSFKLLDLEAMELF